MNNREKFIAKLLIVRPNADITFNYSGNQFYDPSNQLAWEAWQAATKQALEIAYDQAHLNGSAMDVYNILKGENNG